MKNSTDTQLTDKVVLILGLGLHGGGKYSILFAHSQKAKQILVSELATKERFHEIIQSLSHIPIEYEFGGHSKQYIDKADYIIKNPAIPPQSPMLRYAIEQNKKIETDISLFLNTFHTKNYSTNITMVTGTKGKSSISTALYQLQQQHLQRTTNPDRQVQLVGNIRNSVLSVHSAIDTQNTPQTISQHTPHHIVCELSAQQSGDLQYTSHLSLHTIQCLVFTNLMRDHLNYYKDMEDYFNHKIFIFKKFAEHIQQQTIHKSETHTKYSVILPNDTWGKRIASLYKPEHCIWHSSNAILEDDTCGAWAEKQVAQHPNQQLDTYVLYYRTKKNTPAKICCTIETSSIHKNTLKQSEQHQTHSTHYLIQNILIIIAYCIGNNIAIPNTLHSFKQLLTLEHRKESLGTVQGIHFINDSAATIPHAMQIKSIATQPVFLICGGTDKNLRAEDIVPECNAATHSYFLAGSFTDSILPLLRSEHSSYSGPFTHLEDAVHNAIIDAKKMNKHNNTNSIVILSPGCASFGMFKHEFDRGDKFKHIVQEYMRSIH